MFKLIIGELPHPQLTSESHLLTSKLFEYYRYSLGNTEVFSITQVILVTQKLLVTQVILLLK